MTIDNKKRSTMKILAAASGAMAAPGLVAAACNHGATTDITASTPLRGTGLVVSFTDTSAVASAQQVVITNTTDKPVTLSHIYPGVVSTPQGSYDLNSLLTNGTREFAAHDTITLTIEPVKTAEAEYPQPGKASADTWISVQTQDSRINGGQHVKTVRHMYS